ncbi:MAG: hypothetical protein GXZ17_03270 [Candidatus Atribacteria bacterium]|nr:hypothetical protein [Candidatus Atribacteria bacterium]
MFAKVDEIGTLSHLFDEKIAVTPKIRDEISAPLEYGYSFPLKVLSRVKTVPLSKEALEEYERFQHNFTLGKGELEAIAYCKKEGAVFATNDIKAREFAKREGVFVISLQAILKTLWKKNIKSKEEVREMLAKIKEADNLAVSREAERDIFEEIE